MLQPCLTLAGDPPCPDADRDRIEQQIIRAYVRLVTAADDRGSRTVTFARLAGLECRLTETFMPEAPDVPTFWVEIHSVMTGTTLDSFGCFEFDENDLYDQVDVAGELQAKLPTDLQGLAGPLAGALRSPATGAVDRLQRLMPDDAG